PNRPEGTRSPFLLFFRAMGRQRGARVRGEPGMRKTLRRKPSPALVISIIALVLAASGSAMAASKLVKGDSLIKQNSLSGNRLKNHSLTGTQINLSKLGKVPQAAKADTATDATNATNATNAVNATNATTAV